jgi:ATP/maltotriose-dependent transcriptional regulator MalT
MVAWLAVVRVFRGRWTEATDLAGSVLRNPNTAAIDRIMALVALGRVRARRGDPDVATTLEEALVLARPTGTLQRLAPVHAARAEAAWLAGDREATIREAHAAFDLALRHEHAWHIGELAFWLWRAGELTTPPAGAAEPFARQLASDWRGSAAAWRELGCPYEAARALADSPAESDLRLALAELERLGARPAAAQTARRLRERGARAIPRGPRPATRSHPAGLTRREVEVLTMIAEAPPNAEIAARLFLSPKTVERHVSAILAKLGVTSRTAAVREATRRGLLAENAGSPPAM